MSMNFFSPAKTQKRKEKIIPNFLDVLMFFFILQVTLTPPYKFIPNS